MCLIEVLKDKNFTIVHLQKHLRPIFDSRQMSLKWLKFFAKGAGLPVRSIDGNIRPIINGTGTEFLYLIALIQQTFAIYPA